MEPDQIERAAEKPSVTVKTLKDRESHEPAVREDQREFGDTSHTEITETGGKEPCQRRHENMETHAQEGDEKTCFEVVNGKFLGQEG